ncbi:monocarboxylate transporter 2 [Antennarius striatus]|uniref:monocarboxylate transporter 2 n=1 Tax=Antennarius striatus TaxID=241820 RepID=UPI0035B4D398
MDMKAHNVMAAPDGGYSWFILLSCFVVYGLSFGVINSFGVFFFEIHHYFGTTATRASWISSIAVAAIHVIAPVASALSGHYSHRSVVITGGLICSIGIVVGAFARNLNELYVTVGLLNGFGLALTWTPTMSILGLYFDKRRPFANALASAGEDIFTLVLTPLFQLLIDSYSWRGALLILGGLQLNLCVCGILLRPINVTRDVNCEMEDGLPLKLLSIDNSEHSKSHSLETEDLRINNGSDKVTVEACPEIPKGTSDSAVKAPGLNIKKRVELGTRILHYVDFTLITNAHFMVYSMFGLFAALGYFAPALYLVPYARSQGIEEYAAAALMSIFAVLGLCGRVFLGWVANMKMMKMIVQLTATVIMLAIVLLLCPLTSSFIELAAISAAYGVVYGGTVAIHITVLAELVGIHKFRNALGFYMLIRSSGCLFGPPVAGYFIDMMSDYGAGFLMSGVALMIAAVFLLIVNQMNRSGKVSAQ